MNKSAVALNFYSIYLEEQWISWISNFKFKVSNVIYRYNHHHHHHHRLTSIQRPL